MVTQTDPERETVVVFRTQDTRWVGIVVPLILLVIGWQHVSARGDHIHEYVLLFGATLALVGLLSVAMRLGPAKSIRILERSGHRLHGRLASFVGVGDAFEFDIDDLSSWGWEDWTAGEERTQGLFFDARGVAFLLQISEHTEVDYDELRQLSYATVEKFLLHHPKLRHLRTP